MELNVLGTTMSLTSFLVLITIVAFILFLLYDYWAHTYWKRRGIPYEPPSPIMANAKVFTDGVVQAFTDMEKRHGRVYGLFSFRTPVIVIGDPEMLRFITVKNFNNFHSRPEIPQANNEDVSSMVSILEGQRWRDVRNILTPTFSAAKMKQMSSLINANADFLVKHIGNQQEEKGCIECQQLFGSFVMDTVGSCAFGLDIDSQSDPDNPFVKHAKRAFTFDFKNPLFIIGGLIPPLGRLMARFRIATLIPVDVLDFFKDINKKVVSIRRQATSDAKSKRVDFLQLLLDAQKENKDDKASTLVEEDEDDIHADLDKHHDVQYHTNNSLGKRAPLTDQEVFAQMLIFFTAGAETTTTLLGYIFYALSTNPDIQEKLIREVDEVTPSRDSVGYKSIATMPYLDQVVCETLRLFPPAAISNRMCHETFEHNGFKIEKGTQVFIPIYNMHRDPEYWPDPEKFDPERFTKEARAKQHPFAWQPFGAGPRNCIGMRFALMESKMAVVRVLQNFRFETCAQTEIPPKYGMSGFLTPPNGVTLKAVPRADKTV
ncbi:cytochrome P450 3A4-like [Lytechinus variegatus]|uniref:cytochrome P450 3A4-like n=1 Tax=Lytechinus variegatus TaxID=7654 RepID=UPI001BB1C10E|nr:cytochrome P450 3A4-like [Lytechinus variegatus]